MSRITTNVGRGCKRKNRGVSVKDPEEIHAEQSTDTPAGAKEKKSCCPCDTSGLPLPKALSHRRLANYDAAAQGLSSHLLLVRQASSSDPPPNPSKTRRRPATPHAAQSAVAEHLSIIVQKASSHNQSFQAGCCPCRSVGVAEEGCHCSQTLMQCCGCNEEIRQCQDNRRLGLQGSEGTAGDVPERSSEAAQAPAN